MNNTNNVPKTNKTNNTNNNTKKNRTNNVPKMNNTNNVRQNTCNINSRFNSKYLKHISIRYENNTEINRNIFKSEIIKELNGENGAMKLYIEAIKPFKIPNKANDNWVYCNESKSSKCNKMLRIALTKELKSTAYMLRALQMMLLNIDDSNTGENKLYMFVSGKNVKLTGKWDHDKKFLNIDVKRSKLQNNTQKNYLVMGYGPSASGKTFMAKKIVNIVQKENKKNVVFPPNVISIDGGILREASEIYGVIGLNNKHNVLKNNNKCLKNFKNSVGTWPGGIVSTSKTYGRGFKNLVIGFEYPFGPKSIYTSVAKKQCIDYLKNQNMKNKMCFYIPETSAGIGPFPKYAFTKFSSFGKDGSIILRIWQHKESDSCPYKKEFQCAGTIKSGTSRAEKEGKIYSSKMWESSMKASKLFKYSSLYSFDIHNSGRQTGKTIIADLSKNKLIDQFKYKSSTNVNKKNNLNVVSQNIDSQTVYIHRNIPLNHLVNNIGNTHKTKSKLLGMF